MAASEWLQCQLGVWRFSYEKRDLRDKSLHPATFPIALARRCIELFTHKGELVVDPFVGSGTTLLAARDCGRNAVGFDLNQDYVDLSLSRLGAEGADLFGSVQLAACEDAREISHLFEPESVRLILTSPPYANLLNRPRKNKSRRTGQRRNAQFMRVEQYSQDPRDLGTLELSEYSAALREIFGRLLPLLAPGAHCVVNVPDMWWEDTRISIHIAVVGALEAAGYELRNTIIWDRTNIVNRIGIFGWPSNYITMGITYEYLLDFWRPEEQGMACEGRREQ